MSKETISLERLDNLCNMMATHCENMGLEVEETRARIKAYAIKLVPQLDHEAKAFVESLYSESAIWFRPDWTTESFLEATTDLSDADRCKAVLHTRDIGLISWFVNARAGRTLRATDILLSDANSQRKINQSEVDEIEEAITLRDSNLFIDAISDTLLTTAGFAGYVGLAITQNFVEMVEANFTRIAGTFEEAAITKKHWDEKGVPCYIQPTGVGTFPVLVSNEIEVEGVKYPQNKFLKGVGFRDAVPSQTINFIDDVTKRSADDRHAVAQSFDGH